MSYTVPAIRARMGSTDYYQACVSARELAGVAKTAAELEEWKEWSIFERFQRELAMGRVRKEIVPYLIRTRDRFFGAFIILVFHPSVFEFEPLADPDIPRGEVYKHAAEKMGFLTIDGGSLVALDGQHRLMSLREVVNAGDELQGPFRDDVIEDELCVVFIKHEDFEKTRRIFNKVNRHAKPTTAAENIITSEDDGYSIVTRWLVEGSPPLDLDDPAPPFAATDRKGEPVVDWRRGQLKVDSPKFTTLAHLYQTVKYILAANGIRNFDEKHRVNRPSDSELAEAYCLAATWWSATIEQFSCYKIAVNHPALIPHFRNSKSPVSLLFRPAAQVALFQALAGAVERGLALDQALGAAEQISWHPEESPLAGVIIGTNLKMKTRAEAVRRSGRLIEYLIAGQRWDRQEIRSLEVDIGDEIGDESYSLPTPVRRSQRRTE